MSNTLGNYNPIFYAQEGISLLYKALGMASRVYRGYEDERKAFGRGDTVAIKKPSTFTAAAAPSSGAQALATDKVNISLNSWEEVRFSLTDKELAYSGQQIINDHITPAMYALADKIDQDISGLFTQIPAWYGTAGTTPSTPGDLTGIRRKLFDLKCPLDDIHLMVDGGTEAGLLSNAAFAQWQGAAQAGVDTQMRGTLGMKYGMEIFANQNTPSFTAGTASVTALTVNGAFAAGVSTINIDAAAVTGTLVAGDSLKIAGDSNEYAVTGTFTAAANAFTGVTITPALKQAHADEDVITLKQFGGAGGVTTQNLAFHRHFAALILAPLPDFYDGQGVRVFTAVDPFTKLALRARTYAKGDDSSFNVVFDVLYGVAVLDPYKAARLFY